MNRYKQNAITKYYLGIYHGHNATVAVLNENGEITDCVSEERFLSKKNYQGFPVKCIEYIFNKYGKENVISVGLPFKTMNPVYITKESGEYIGPQIIKTLLAEFRLGLLRFNRELYNFMYKIYLKTVSRYAGVKQVKATSELLDLPISKVKDFDHQICHAYSAYYLSPYNKEDALVLTLDGEGDGMCATVNTVINGEFKTIASTPLGNSLGWMYMDLTRYMGMTPMEHEYKIMGLAPYAKPEHVEKVYEKIKEWITVDGLVFKSEFDTHQTYEMISSELRETRFDNLAGAFQKLVEIKMSEWVTNCIKETGLTTVCCGGGVFMNVKANMVISQIPELKKLWVMPSAGDESTAMGAAIAAYIDANEDNRSTKDLDIKSLNNLYLGPEFSIDDIELFIKKHKLNTKYKVIKSNATEKDIAELIADGHVVANMSGRMEWGARALGNRSILANPSKPDVIREINEYIKNRDFWMPFAGSILEESAKDYLINPKNISSDYMIMSFQSTKKAQDELRAALHPYDFTIRPQIVSKESNPRYHKIISEFKKVTGIGGVLNTSFNLHGLPIVLGPKEALHVFENSSLPYLVLEDYIISK